MGFLKRSPIYALVDIDLSPTCRAARPWNLAILVLIGAVNVARDLDQALAANMVATVQTREWLACLIHRTDWVELA